MSSALFYVKHKQGSALTILKNFLNILCDTASYTESAGLAGSHESTCNRELSDKFHSFFYLASKVLLATFIMAKIICFG